MNLANETAILWRTEKLGKLAQVKGGKRLPRGEKLLTKPTQFPYIRVCNFKNFSVNVSDLQYLSPEIQDKISRYIITKNDVFISIAGTIGRVGIIPEELDGANLTENAARIVLESGGVLEKQYLKYCLACPRVQNDIASRRSKNAQPKLALAQIKGLEIPLPPLPEQKKIAHILSTVQRAIEIQERIIQTTTELKKALMQKLFTEGLRGEPQKQTDIGLVPESWKVKKVGDIATLKSGGTPSRKKTEYWDKGNISWVKTGEVDYCTILDTEEKITRVGLDGSSAKLFPAGTLLMAMYGQGITRGKVALLGIEAATNQACAAFFPDEEVDTKYLYFYFEYSYDAIRNFAHGANQKNLSADIIKSFPVSYPEDKNQQKEIAQGFAVIDKKIKSAKKKKLALQDLFRTLLHELMTAKTRVDSLNLTALVD